MGMNRLGLPLKKTKRVEGSKNGSFQLMAYPVRLQGLELESPQGAAFEFPVAVGAARTLPRKEQTETFEWKVYGFIHFDPS